MAMYNTSEQLLPEAFMIPITGSNSHMIDMGGEVTPELVFDQNMYYPNTGSYYGYYCPGPTGFESPSEWDDHHSYFGTDSLDPHVLGLQTENSPYVYYTSNYGYGQSPYNPYNPYIPGAMGGLDGSYVGTHQYLTSTSYQQPVSSSSSSYFPIVMPSGLDVTPSSSDPLMLCSGGGPVTNKQSSACINYTPSLVSGNSAVTSQRFSSESSRLGHSQTSAHQINSAAKWSEGPLINAISAKQFSSHGSITSGVASHVNQGRSSLHSLEPNDNFVYGRNPSVDNASKISMPCPNGYTGLGSHPHGWLTYDKFKPRYQYNRTSHNITMNPDFLNEQNRGPRTQKSKGLLTSAFAVRAYTARAGDVDDQGNIIIHADQYNRDDFSYDYPEAKFFVIKSYSEDDVHKSIKYNVWSSTPNGNKRLASAYEDAQRINLVRQRKCPIFLFFSVNASGQFCGVAEMIGPVDFSRDMDFWQQDKWAGSFPVKWHIVKDVLNPNFRQVILENNENKPVTNSRDTQEITYLPGMRMLNIFKNSPMRTSLLDDFLYYEGRQKVMHDEKCKHFDRKYNNSSIPSAQSLSQGLANVEGAVASVLSGLSLNSKKELLNDTTFVQPLIGGDKSTLVDIQDADNQNDKVNITVDAEGEYSNDGQYSEVRIENGLREDERPPNHKAVQLSNDAKKPASAVKKIVRADGKQAIDNVKDTSGVEGKQQKCKVDHSIHDDLNGLREDERQPNHKAVQLSNDAKNPASAVKKIVRADGKQANDNFRDTSGVEGKQQKCKVDHPIHDDVMSGYLKTKTQAVLTENKAGEKTGSIHPKKAANLDEETNHGTRPVDKTASIGPQTHQAKKAAAEVPGCTLADVVTVGSMHIVVRKFDESSRIITVGTIPIDPKGVNMERDTAWK